MKWWMFGSKVSVEPQAVAYHLCAPRGYSYNHNDYVHNVLMIGHALGMDEWVERAYLNWIRKGDVATLERLWKEAKNDVVEDREFIRRKAVKTFNELLLERPWDRLNDEKYGRHNSALTIFHDTWLPLIKGTPAEELYNNSEKQKGLEKFIEEHLTEFIYKRGYVEPTFDTEKIIDTNEK
jgi:hypothetical protein